MKILSKSKGDDATDMLGTIATELFNLGLIEESDERGLEEGLLILHDFEIHVIRKRERKQ